MSLEHEKNTSHVNEDDVCFRCLFGYPVNLNLCRFLNGNDKQRSIHLSRASQKRQTPRSVLCGGCATIRCGFQHRISGQRVSHAAFVCVTWNVLWVICLKCSRVKQRALHSLTPLADKNVCQKKDEIIRLSEEKECRGREAQAPFSDPPSPPLWSELKAVQHSSASSEGDMTSVPCHLH